jgi:hypothetical protein
MFAGCCRSSTELCGWADQMIMQAALKPAAGRLAVDLLLL